MPRELENTQTELAFCNSRTRPPTPYEALVSMGRDSNHSSTMPGKKALPPEPKLWGGVGSIRLILSHCSLLNQTSFGWS